MHLLTPKLAMPSLLSQITKTPYKSVPLRSVGGRPVQIPYDFHAEFKPQEMGIEIRLLVNDGVSYL